MSRRRTGTLIAALVLGAALVASATVVRIPDWSTSPDVDARAGTGLAVAQQAPAYAVTPYGNGLALTPPMGWNGYNRFGLHVTGAMVEAMARALVTTHLRDAGYTYVNLDGGWDLRRRAGDSQLIADPHLFPHGVKPVVDYVHSLGLKFGIYASAGTKNCQGTSAGSYGHYQQDAQTFAGWGVDYVKLDWCYLPVRIYPKMSLPQLGFMLAQRMGSALAATGRHIVLDVNDWTNDRPWTWGRDLGNVVRTAPDIQDNYQSMVSNFIHDMSHYQLAGPDHWNDPDMLEVGNGGMSSIEYRTMFSLWAEEAAPLIAGNDLTEMSAGTLAILGNQFVIEVDQDPLGSQGYPVTNARGHWVLTKPLSNNRRAVVLFNQTNQAAVISTTVKAIGLSGAPQYTLRDLWTQDLSVTSGRISATVPAHGVVMLLVG